MQKNLYELDCRAGDFFLVGSLVKIREALEQVFEAKTGIFVSIQEEDEDGDIIFSFHSDNYGDLPLETLENFEKKGWLKDDWTSIILEQTKSTIALYSKNSVATNDVHSSAIEGKEIAICHFHQDPYIEANKSITVDFGEGNITKVTVCEECYEAIVVKK
ncbi:hypothetical protein ACFVAD_20275 [Sutcliffiella sp. NPDC057660]|uniref:hypothetical protein n=1 Tax=Sutcliffiella sp. NPDC057660 TaxID=3346199 RepID=UPI0036A56A26